MGCRERGCWKGEEKNAAEVKGSYGKYEKGKREESMYMEVEEVRRCSGVKIIENN